MVILMRNDTILNLNMKSAIQQLQKWGVSYIGHQIDLQFSETQKIGHGKIEHSDIQGTPAITIGVYPLRMSFWRSYLPVKDSDFVKIGVTTFHELSHYKHSLSDMTPKEILTSDLSKCHNNEYYHTVHHKLPHEINAEYSGVMSMWSALESEWPDAADRLMFDYLDYRTEESDRVRKLYMIERPEGGFQSKQQVKDLFNAAYEESLTGKRHLPDTFLTFDDDTSRLLATDDGRGVRTEYVPVYMELSKADTGMDTDLMMASLVSHVHPELQDMYARIDFEKLEPAEIFESPVPETTEEIRSRLGYGDSFTEGVDYITGLSDKGLHR